MNEKEQRIWEEWKCIYFLISFDERKSSIYKVHGI